MSLRRFELALFKPVVIWIVCSPYVNTPFTSSLAHSWIMSGHIFDEPVVGGMLLTEVKDAAKHPIVHSPDSSGEFSNTKCQQFEGRRVGYN